MALSKEEILDAISEMSVMDVVDLVKLMEEKFGVTAAAPVAAAAAPINIWVWLLILVRFFLRPPGREIETTHTPVR